MTKYNKQIALLFLIIIFITVINIFVGKTITLKPCIIFAVALAIYHLLAAIDLSTRIGLRHIDLGGAAARTVFCLDFFITLACTLLIVILSITGSIKERRYE